MVASLTYNSPGPVASAFIRSRDPKQLILGPIGCLSADHEYLSREGWKPISQYKGEEVFVHDPIKNQNFYEYPSRFIQEKSDWFFHIKDHNVDQMLSWEHQVPHYKTFISETAFTLTAQTLYEELMHGGVVYLPHLDEQWVLSRETISRRSIAKVKTPGAFKYCFTTSTGFFITRRNGVVTITGNSGKSAAAVIKIFSLCLTQRKSADGIRRSRWAVVRNTKQMLTDTTIKTWFDWIKPHTPGKTDGFGTWREVDRVFIMHFNDVYAEILFRALDKPEDVGRLLSLELTGVWFNEAREISVELFGHAYGRCGRYPSIRNGGSAWSGAIADTNAPMFDSDWFRAIEALPQVDDEPESVVNLTVFKQPSGLSAEAENTHNLVAGYYEDKAKGKTRDEINVYIHGDYGVSEYGKPVYARQFDQQVHISKEPLRPMLDLPVVVGMDLGLTPAAALYQCDWTGRLFIMAEIAEFDMGIERFCRSRLLPMLDNKFPGCPRMIIIDPAGLARSQNDERRATDVLRTFGLKCIPADNNDPDSRIQATRQLLDGWVDGKPRLQIDPSCRWIRRGMLLKYMFQKHRDGTFSPTPFKNEYSHIMDAVGYGAMYMTKGFKFEDALEWGAVQHSYGNYFESVGPADSHTGY